MFVTSNAKPMRTHKYVAKPILPSFANLNDDESQISEPVPIVHDDVYRLFQITDELSSNLREVMNAYNLLQTSYQETQRTLTSLSSTVSTQVTLSRNNFKNMESALADLEIKMNQQLAKCKSYMDKRLSSELQDVQQYIKVHDSILNRNTMLSNVASFIIACLFFGALGYLVVWSIQ